MAWTKEDKSFKTLINRRVTSSSKAFYEEIGDTLLDVHYTDVWAQPISSTPAIAVSEGVAELRTLFALTQDTTVGNNQCYYAYESGNRLKDWISDKYGSGYQIRLFQNDNTEIFPASALNWIFDYRTGILTLNGNTSGMSLPFKITGYRYVGVKGTLSGADWQRSVLNRFNPTGGLPETPSTGDRYISMATANGWINTHLYEYNGSSWNHTTSAEGMSVYVKDEDAVYVFNGTSWVGISGGSVSSGYIPVMGSIGYENSYIKQGYVDIEGSNTPIISYNDPTFISPPTGLACNKLYQQFALGNNITGTKSFFQSFYHMFGIDHYPSYAYQFGGFISDDLSSFVLSTDGYASAYLFTQFGIVAYSSEMGSMGDTVALDNNRLYTFLDNGPGYNSLLQLGAGFYPQPVSGLVFPAIMASFQGLSNGPILVLGLSSEGVTETDQGSLQFGKTHTNSYVYGDFVPTINGEPLGQIRFHGSPSNTTSSWTQFDARIRAVQNGNAAADGVPVNLFIETSTGSVWNINQIVAKSDGTVNIGTTTSTQKLHVAGNIDIDSGNYYRVNNVQVLAGRNTGWSTPEGTAVKDNSGWNADTITATDGNVQSIAKAVKALIDAGIAHGFLGA